jgi:hypothetical protein
LWGVPFDAAIFGLIFTAKAFIWSFLLTCVLLRLVGPSGIGTAFLLSLWSGTVADWAARRLQSTEELV